MNEETSTATGLLQCCPPQIRVKLACIIAHGRQPAAVMSFVQSQHCFLESWNLIKVWSTASCRDYSLIDADIFTLSAYSGLPSSYHDNREWTVWQHWYVTPCENSIDLSNWNSDLNNIQFEPSCFLSVIRLRGRLKYTLSLALHWLAACNKHHLFPIHEHVLGRQKFFV
jgi:hypothetical protein